MFKVFRETTWNERIAVLLAAALILGPLAAGALAK
ncbi:hypothetical protein M2323_000480 [Rhodoblastus acidophilus]|nr:hypothetical protein [Rhodoblastus acidophilus]MCW2331580.1 hypothetical protein [Rhodoblastus acidophilus]